MKPTQQTKQRCLDKWENIVNQLEHANAIHETDWNDACALCHMVDQETSGWERACARHCPLWVEGESVTCHPAWDELNRIDAEMRNLQRQAVYQARLLRDTIAELPTRPSK